MRQKAWVVNEGTAYLNTLIKSQWVSWHKSRRESKKLQVGWRVQSLSKFITFESQRQLFLT